MIRVLLFLAVAAIAAEHRLIVDPNGSGKLCVVVSDTPRLFCDTPISAKGWSVIWGLDTVHVDTTKETK